MRLVTAFIMVLAMTGLALAACPDLNGIWSNVPDSNPEYHSILEGRLSDAWCGGVPGESGNMMDVQSWDDSALGLEWKFWGMTVDAAGGTMVYDGVTGGNGIRITEYGFDGGQFWLSGDGLWTDGDVELTGAVLDYTVIRTETFVGGEIVAAVSNITFEGTFDDCDSCHLYATANSNLVWRSGYAWAMPAGYPGFLCGDGGELGEFYDMTVGIECEGTATAPRSWSGIKTLYR